MTARGLEYVVIVVAWFVVVMLAFAAMATLTVKMP